MLKTFDLRGHEVDASAMRQQFIAFGYAHWLVVNNPGAPNHGQAYDLSFIDNLDETHICVLDDPYTVEVRIKDLTPLEHETRRVDPISEALMKLGDTQSPA